MDDLISRQAAINAADIADYTGLVVEDVKSVTDEVVKELKKLPSAQPERKRGRWIEYINSHCECPFCHKEWSYFDNDVECFNFCPNCGADMRGENE